MGPPPNCTIEEILLLQGRFMTGGLASSVLGYLRRLAGNTASGDSDGALLAQFVDARDETAFAALLARHGPMVLRVCERVLGPGCDAEDAFQATFLLLVRRAGSLRRGDSLGSWLHTAAYRIAARARAQRARRRERERRAVPRPEETPALDLAWGELQAVLDEELHNLPEKYRAPLLL